MAGDLEAQAEKLFLRNPLHGAMVLVVAGNALPGARVTDVEGKSVMLPDWDATEWSWWLRACLDMAAEMESARPETAKPDAELEAMRAEASGVLSALASGNALAEKLQGDDEIGWLAFAGRVLMSGGRLLGRQVVRAAKWGAPIAKRAAARGWAAMKSAFRSAPVKVVAGTALLVAPDQAIKVAQTAATMLGELFGGTVKGLVTGLGPFGLLAIAVAAYFMFFRKGE